jgi:hypothetical protein
VRTGRYSASIRVALNSPDTSAEADSGYRGPDLPVGQRRIPLPDVRTATQALDAFKLGDTIWTSVTLDYAQGLEDGNSRKAKDGIFGPTLLFWERSLRANLRGDGQALYSTIYTTDI